MTDIQVPTDVLLSLNECASMLRTSADVLLALTPLDDEICAALLADSDAPVLSAASVESWREILS